MLERANASLRNRLAEPAPSPVPVVYVVDDDLSIRESLEGLLRAAGWQAKTFATANAFLARPNNPCPACVILDVSLPDLTGLELQRLINAERDTLPIIFITGHRDVPMTVQAMKAGALEFLTKPFSVSDLMDAVGHAIQKSRARLALEGQLATLRSRYATLTPREQQVMALVVRGKLNKQVGGELGISEITVKAHRGQAMQKMKARSLAELVRIADSLGVYRNPISGTGNDGPLPAVDESSSG